MSPKRGMQLDRVVLLGRTLDEYARYFLLDPARWAGQHVLDVAGGVSSFCAEANALGIHAVACDPIYAWDVERIRAQAEPDLAHVYKIVEGLPTYRWDYYRDRDHMRELRGQALRQFLPDFEKHGRTRYVPGLLPNLPFPNARFDLTLVSYFLFAYDDKLDYAFHLAAIVELMRVTKGELRIYPTVTFEAEESVFVRQLQTDPSLKGFRFEIVKTDFEFLLNSNCFLKITRDQSA